MFMSIFILPFLPILILRKSKQLNYYLNQGIYVFKFLLPFMAISISINLLGVPFVYLRVLYCILRGRYSNQIYLRIK